MSNARQMIGSTRNGRFDALVGHFLSVGGIQLKTVACNCSGDVNWKRCDKLPPFTRFYHRLVDSVIETDIAPLSWWIISYADWQQRLSCNIFRYDNHVTVICCRKRVTSSSESWNHQTPESPNQLRKMIAKQVQSSQLQCTLKCWKTRFEAGRCNDIIVVIFGGKVRTLRHSQLHLELTGSRRHVWCDQSCTIDLR